MMKSMLILTTLVVSLFGFAGGGGSSSDYGGGSSSSDSGWSSSDWGSSDRSGSRSDKSGGSWGGIAIAFGAITYILVVLLIVVSLSKKKSKNSANPLSLADKGKMIASLTDADFNDTKQERWIHSEAERIFMKYQEDWSNFNYR